MKCSVVLRITEMLVDDGGSLPSIDVSRAQ
jgi:hypothetical protein